MKYIADLHIHSKYSGGTSKSISILTIARSCEIKGINIVGTGDCLCGSWLENLKTQLQEECDGIYIYPKLPSVKFILQTEVELIWKVNKLIKRAHFIVLFPCFTALKEILEKLSKFVNLRTEGRPKIYSSAENFILDLKKIDSRIEIIPAHIFTPYFGILGSECSFKSLKEALGSGFEYIHALESGLSADPSLIKALSELNGFSIISNSDAHSTGVHRIGREATVLKLKKLNYSNIIDSIRKNKILKTYEFRPSAGKYYYDGHRIERHSNQKIQKEYYCSPKRGIVNCPYCEKKLTKGVLSRVYDLMDQDIKSQTNCQYIVPLYSLISTVRGKVNLNNENLSLYLKLIEANQCEYNIWEGSSIFEGIEQKIINAINKVRNGEFYFFPGYDGIYGKLNI